MSRRKKLCAEYRCERPAVRMFRCEEHDAEHEQKRHRREQAVEVLHHGVTLTTTRLQEEMERLRAQWRKVCEVETTQRGTREIPLEESRYAVEWCINFAAEILAADPIVATGGSEPHGLVTQRENDTFRFVSLTAGLMSNGHPRHSPPTSARAR